MKFSVDPWDPSYGTSLDSGPEEPAADVDAGVEVAPSAWAPVPLDPSVEPPSAVLFVDGVRRVDAQVWVGGSDGAAAPGLCASYAAGVVCCCADGAHLESGVVVRRGLFTTAPDAVDVVTGAGAYRATSTPDRPDVAPMQLLSLALQRDLAEAELVAAGTARDGRSDTDDLLVVDGPVRGSQDLPRVIGVVKTHRSDYLPSELAAVVPRLRAGERTPVFRIVGSWERHTWYLRLPCPPGAPWAGVVRVECSATLSPDAAVRTAAVTQRVLPRFASVSYKDSRAPQNLYPIGGLERELRRRLGDSALLYRALRRAASDG
ncbi:hypothetical protein [Pseudonocardia endophytica]|uniref:NurA domain-containing protein n=1 Tax=Pseudonocardia endophytica TaxID=401976 RepID=A0A4R1HQ33_PSEEN|nr:hypothetical protein [Pseudonocardia endophytica]TCK22805.1 hypothetical protein EV378_6816 [Pseudonocardia endophytica]